MRCQDCPNEAEYTLINGEEKSVLCSVDLKEELFELVTENDTVSFHSGPLPVLNKGRGRAVRQRQVVEVL